MQAQGELKKLATAVQKAVEIEKLFRDNGVSLVTAEPETPRSMLIFKSEAINSTYKIELFIEDEGRECREHSYDLCVYMYDRRHDDGDCCIDLVTSDTRPFSEPFTADLDMCPECRQEKSQIYQLRQVLNEESGRILMDSEQSFALITAMAKLFRSAS